MYKGFYNLTSAMLTHQQNLNVIGNNMANISTAGFKQERYTATTFDEVMYSRVGNKNSLGNEIGKQSYIRAASQIYTDYEQGTLEPTGMPWDFAISGEGFFAVQQEDGSIGYTRMGNFALDTEGYVTVPGYGYVLSPAKGLIRLSSDKVHTDGGGRLIYDMGGAAGQIGVFTFDDTAALERNEQDLFVGADGVPVNEPELVNGYLERSNTDMVRQMTEMISVQRSLQSAAQLSKMYDQLMTKATNEIGRV